MIAKLAPRCYRRTTIHRGMATLKLLPPVIILVVIIMAGLAIKSMFKGLFLMTRLLQKCYRLIANEIAAVCLLFGFFIKLL